jgi:hypothetical protein
MVTPSFQEQWKAKVDKEYLVQMIASILKKIRYILLTKIWFQDKNHMKINNLWTIKINRKICIRILILIILWWIIIRFILTNINKKTNLSFIQIIKKNLIMGFMFVCISLRLEFHIHALYALDKKVYAKKRIAIKYVIRIIWIQKM